jgi:EAL domain-containing protein (putative c-di-GMP-specific phosphodiesterase class I)
LVISFNATSRDFAEPHFYNKVLETLSQLRIPANNLQVEITGEYAPRPSSVV